MPTSSYVLGHIAVAVDHPERGGIDEINVPRHRLAEGRLGALARVRVKAEAVWLAALALTAHS
jgi:hypothetical protein